MLRPHARHTLAVALATAIPAGVLASCTGGDDGSTTVESTVVTTPATTPATTPVTEPAPATEAPARTADASTTTDGTVASTLLPPPPDLDELAAALLGSSDVGVPDTWAIRDLDPAIMDQALELDADPFQGFLDCDDASLHPEEGWIQRTFTAPDRPLDNGLLRIDLIVAVQPASAFEDNLVGFGSCTTTGADTGVVTTAIEVAPDGTGGTSVPGGHSAAQIQVTAGPSVDVPYPSAYTAVTANVDGRTVTAVVGGIDSGVPFEVATRQLVGQLLERL